MSPPRDHSVPLQYHESRMYVMSFPDSHSVYRSIHGSRETKPFQTLCSASVSHCTGLLFQENFYQQPNTCILLLNVITRNLPRLYLPKIHFLEMILNDLLYFFLTFFKFTLHFFFSTFFSESIFMFTIVAKIQIDEMER